MWVALLSSPLVIAELEMSISPNLGSGPAMKMENKINREKDSEMARKCRKLFSGSVDEKISSEWMPKWKQAIRRAAS